MTIAISLKVHDGLVLASDSASTIVGIGPGGPQGVINIYDNANKIQNLCKGRPLGVLTWGAGSIGNASLSTLFKDLRAKFAGTDQAWKLDDVNSTVEHVARKAREFLFEDRYVAAHGAGAAPGKPSMGILIAGYSHDAGLPESWLITVAEGDCQNPVQVQPQDNVGCYFDGQPEAIQRFLRGYGDKLQQLLGQIVLDPGQLASLMNQIEQAMAVPMIISAMPIQDAIDLAEFLVNLTKAYSRFSPGAPCVGGPTEIAAITKHEGFKWIKRKHYFEQRLNPGGTHNEHGL